MVYLYQQVVENHWIMHAHNLCTGGFRKNSDSVDDGILQSLLQIEWKHPRFGGNFSGKSGCFQVEKLAR
jgi:hypothetical protein